MKPALVLLGEMLTFVLMCFFGVLAIVTPWCTWKIICIVLCAVIGIGFIALFFLSRNPKYKFVADEEETQEEIKEDEATTQEEVDVENTVQEETNEEVVELKAE